MKDTLELFKDLSNRDVTCQQCYYLWKTKRITLEQSLILAVTSVREQCNRLIGFVPVKDVGVLLDYLYYLDTLGENGSLVWQLFYLVEYSTKLRTIANYYIDRRPFKVILPMDELTKSLISEQ